MIMGERFTVRIPFEEYVVPILLTTVTKYPSAKRDALTVTLVPYSASASAVPVDTILSTFLSKGRKFHAYCMGGAPMKLAESVTLSPDIADTHCSGWEIMMGLLDNSTLTCFVSTPGVGLSRFVILQSYAASSLLDAFTILSSLLFPSNRHTVAAPLKE